MTAPAAGLWPHQDEAAELAGKLLGPGGRAQLHMACGTGKTAVAAEVSRIVAPSGQVLVLAPAVLLLTQALAEFRRVIGDAGTGRVLVVCSDTQAGAGAQAAREELDAWHIPVTTDPAQIARAAGAGGRVTVAATYAGLGTLAAAHASHGLGPWDLIIADEAHRVAGAGTRPWARVHHDEVIPAQRRLYMTATPRVLAGGAAAGLDVASMDDETVFGPVACRLGFATAIELGLLASYRLVISLVSDAEVRALAEAGNEGLIRHGPAPVPARVLAAQIAVLRAALQFGLRRAISYHTRIADARRFAATLDTAAALLPETERPASIWAGEVHGGHTTQQRQLRLAHLAAGDAEEDFALVCNARLLSEGVDVPAVDAVVFCDPRRSYVDVIQAVGRPLRRGGDAAKTATIIVPLLADPGQDPAGALDGSAWAPVWRVIRALRAHDDDLAATLDARRRALGASPAPDPWEPDWLHVQAAGLPGGFAQAVTVMIVRQAAPDWEEYYGAAASYYQQHGHLLVPGRWQTPAGLGLGNWLHNQRTSWYRGRLAPGRIGRLEAIGMIWNTDGIAWDQALARAAAYRARHGHLDIPGLYHDSDQFALGAWLNNQRMQHRDGTLTPERRQRLDELGIEWDPLQAAWERGLAAARAYRAEHGHLDVPQNCLQDGYPLGSWLTRQRCEHRDGTLAPARRQQLEQAGIEWDPLQAAWEHGLAAARAYRDAYGHLDVPKDYTDPGGFRLGSWIAVRRRSHRNGTLPPGHAQALEQFGITWNTRTAKWEQGLAAAHAYHAEHGHLRVPRTYTTPGGYPLGRWLAGLRYRPSRLTGSRRAELGALDPCWNERSPATPPAPPDAPARTDPGSADPRPGETHG